MAATSLPYELDRALRRATDRSIASLTALRRALRAHVHSERGAGGELDEIQLGLRAIILRAHADVPVDEAGDILPHILTKQLLTWSEGFYAEKLVAHGSWHDEGRD